MTAASDAIMKASRSLPLKVVRTEWQDPALLLHGEDWRMTVMTPWRILLQGRLLFGSDDVSPDAISNLLTRNIVIGCRPQSGVAQLDPAFEFSSGHVLEIFSVSPIEPWVLSFGTSDVFVASPSE